MTTIAIDKFGTIAADGLRIWSGDIVTRDDEKIRVRYGRIYAMTGTAAYFEPLIHWHGVLKAEVEKAPEVFGDNSWTLLVIEKPGEVIKYSDTCPFPECFPTPIAFGAGIDLAKGAMLFGATASQAVQLVAESTNHTGGRVLAYDIAEKLARKAQPQPVLEAAE